MESNANEPINPIRGKMQGEKDFKGLTKREYFAGLAMQGLLANASVVGSDGDVAKASINCADALISELEKQK